MSEERECVRVGESMHLQSYQNYDLLCVLKEQTTLFLSKAEFNQQKPLGSLDENRSKSSPNLTCIVEFFQSQVGSTDTPCNKVESPLLMINTYFPEIIPYFPVGCCKVVFELYTGKMQIRKNVKFIVSISGNVHFVASLSFLTLSITKSRIQLPESGMAADIYPKPYLRAECRTQVCGCLLSVTVLGISIFRKTLCDLFLLRCNNFLSIIPVTGNSLHGSFLSLQCGVPFETT